MASIRKRGKTYTIVVSLGRDVNDKKITESVTFTPTKTTPKAIEKEVQAFAIEFEDKVRNGKYYKGEKLTFEDFIPLWEKDYAKDNITPAILEGYKAQINRYVLPAIGNMKLSKINAIHLNGIYNSMRDNGKSAGSIRRTHSIISSIFTRAYKWGIIQENPCKRVDLPKNNTKKEMKCFTVDQAQIFLDKALHKPFTTTYAKHNRINQSGKITSISSYSEEKEMQFQFIVYFNLALYSGCRRGELIALTWNDIDFEKKSISISKSATVVDHVQVVKVPKTRAGYREITLPDDCMSLLKKLHMQQKELCFRLGDSWKGCTSEEFENNSIFIQENGLQMCINTPTHKLRKIIENYNKDIENEKDKLPLIRLHDLRHTSASLLIASGLDPVTVSHRLGHSKTSVTLDIYSHAFDQLDKKASDTLEDLFSKKA